MIKVCDAIMGSGKSSACIRYINENPEQRFIYIAQYLEEADRIIDACRSREFAKPSDKLPEFSFSKLEHTRFLLQIGCDIATTHKAFRSYTPDMIENIKKFGYVLLVDEAVETFEEMKCSVGDIDLLINAGHAVRTENGIQYTGVEYTGEKLRDLYEMIRCNNLFQTKSIEGRLTYFYWALLSDVMLAFKDVIIMTYLFETSDLYYYFRMHDIAFEYIGVLHEDDRYSFTDGFGDVPEYVSRLPEMITIVDNPKLNQPGDNRRAFSQRWMLSHKTEMAATKNHIHNFFQNKAKSKSKDVMWSTTKAQMNALKGKGYALSYTTFNLRAKNDLRHKTVLAYCVNIYRSPQCIQFFSEHGIKYDQDGYALSTMLQWIWRSAIRDGKPIQIYIPSSRMRGLLIQWMDDVSKGVRY